MTKYIVTNIQKLPNDTVNFYNGLEVVRNFSQVVPQASTYITYSGATITLILPQSEAFSFDIWRVGKIGAVNYTPLRLDASQAQIKERVIEIYTELVENVFKGCCDCGGGTNTCAVQYLYGTEAGHFSFTSGLLIMDFTSNNGVDLSGFLHHLPDGSWISFYGSEDPSVFAVYEISGYSDVSGYAVWTAVLIDGEPSITSGTSFCVSFQPALSSGGGGSQSWQQTLDVDPNLDKDNTVSGTGTTFTWDDLLAMYFFLTGDFEVIIDDGTGNSSDIYTNSYSLTNGVSALSGEFTGLTLQNTGGSVSARLEARDGGSNFTAVDLKKDLFKLITPNVAAATAVNGQVLTLIDDTNGEVEFQDASGPGLVQVTSNITNSNTDTMADITGLNFSVVAGTYKIKMFCAYDSSSTAVGSRWGCTFPATTYCAYRSQYSLTATSQSINPSLSTGDAPAASNATSGATTGNTAIIEGIWIFSTSGTWQGRFACETNLGTITFKTGYIEYTKIA